MDKLGSYQARQRLQYEKKTPQFIQNMLTSYEAPRRHFTSVKRKEVTGDVEEDAPTIVHLDEEGKEIDDPSPDPVQANEPSSSKLKSNLQKKEEEPPSVDAQGKLMFKKKKLNEPSDSTSKHLTFSSSSSARNKESNKSMKPKQTKANPSTSKKNKSNHLLSFPES